jgi:hypothetical protein
LLPVAVAAVITHQAGAVRAVYWLALHRSQLVRLHIQLLLVLAAAAVFLTAQTLHLVQSLQLAVVLAVQTYSLVAVAVLMALLAAQVVVAVRLVLIL